MKSGIKKIIHPAGELIDFETVFEENSLLNICTYGNELERVRLYKPIKNTVTEMEKQIGETPLEFCIRMGWEKTIYEMLVTDHLILNRDRHGANIEVLRDRKKRTVRLAPLFDHGLSLLFSARPFFLQEFYHALGVDAAARLHEKDVALG